MTQSLEQKHIAIVGGGVIGLTSGIRLLEAGFKVSLFARELSPATTSDVAAAMWHPGGAASERVRGWCQTNLDVFKALIENAEAGIKFVTIHEVSDKAFEDDALRMADDFRPVDADLFPAPWSCGFSFTAARIDVPSYMVYLLKRFEALGGSMHERTIHDLKDLAEEYALIVNASGVGAKELADDDTVYPVRGQIMSVRKPKGLKDDIIHVHTNTTFTYIVPRENDCILGGTYQENDANMQPIQSIADAIIERTSLFNADFKEPEIFAHKVGLRPARPEVRLELEEAAGLAVIHNYGHGSNGHTWSWGCADEVVGLARAFVS